METLEKYFSDLIAKVEGSSDITNQGKNKDGFFLPTRSVLLKHLNVLKDLHAKPLAKPMVKDAWSFVVENLPPEMLVLSPVLIIQIRAMLSPAGRNQRKPT